MSFNTSSTPYHDDLDRLTGQTREQRMADLSARIDAIRDSHGEWWLATSRRPRKPKTNRRKSKT